MTTPKPDNQSRFFLPLLSFGFIIIYFASMSEFITLLSDKDAETLSDFAIFGGVAFNAIFFSLLFGAILAFMPFRWSKKKTLKSRFVAVVYGWLAGLGISMLFALFFHVIDYKPELQQVAKKIANIHPDYVYLVLLGPALFVPLVEEIIFRGFLYRSIVAFSEPDELNVQIENDLKKLNRVKIIAMLITSAIFALAHMEIHVMPQLFILGMIFNYAYEKTGSIAVATSLHILNNLFGIVSLLIHGIPTS